MPSVADSIGIRSHGIAGAKVHRIASALTAAGSSTRRRAVRRASRPSRFAIATVPGENCVWGECPVESFIQGGL
jgi:hypothetical protein